MFRDPSLDSELAGFRLGIFEVFVYLKHFKPTFTKLTRSSFAELYSIAIILLDSEKAGIYI